MLGRTARLSSPERHLCTFVSTPPLWFGLFPLKASDIIESEPEQERSHPRSSRTASSGEYPRGWGWQIRWIDARSVWLWGWMTGGESDRCEQVTSTYRSGLSASQKRTKIKGWQGRKDEYRRGQSKEEFLTPFPHGWTRTVFCSPQMCARPESCVYALNTTYQMNGKDTPLQSSPLMTQPRCPKLSLLLLTTPLPPPPAAASSLASRAHGGRRWQRDQMYTFTYAFNPLDKPSK